MENSSEPVPTPSHFPAHSPPDHLPEHLLLLLPHCFILLISSLHLVPSAASLIAAWELLKMVVSLLLVPANSLHFWLFALGNSYLLQLRIKHPYVTSLEVVAKGLPVAVAIAPYGCCSNFRTINVPKPLNRPHGHL